MHYERSYLRCAQEDRREHDRAGREQGEEHAYRGEPCVEQGYPCTGDERGVEEDDAVGCVDEAQCG